MIIVEKDGNKRYRFEDTDLLARRNFEKTIDFADTSFVKMMLSLMEEARTRQAEAWRMAKEKIHEIDPTLADDAEFSYNAFKGEFMGFKSKE